MGLTLEPGLVGLPAAVVAVLLPVLGLRLLGEARLQPLVLVAPARPEDGGPRR